MLAVPRHFAYSCKQSLAAASVLHMAENDMFKRYLDAGMAFTQLTRARAEEMVKELVKAGELQRDQAQDRVEVLDRSRKNTDQLLDMMRKEISKQLAAFGVATKDNIARLERGVRRRAGPRRRTQGRRGQEGLTGRQRLDAELVRRGLVGSRQQAQADDRRRRRHRGRCTGRQGQPPRRAP